jgi:murein DD-endopeptidase MepM/ murein hydrolase activator NlpD
MKSIPSKGRGVWGFLLILSFVLPHLSFANEEVVQELQTKIQSSQELIQNIDKEIIQYQQQLNKVSGERKTLESTVKELDLTNKRLQATIQSTSVKIDDTEKNIETLTLSIGELENRIDRNKYLISNYIQAINEIEHSPVAFSILKEKEFGQMVRALNNYSTLKRVFNEEIREFNQDLVNLGATKRIKEEEKVHFQSLVEDHKVQKQTVEKTKQEKNVLLQETKGEESEYQKILNEKIALKKQFEESLLKFESDLAYVLNPSSYPAPKQGIFAWPLDYILITQPFGLTADSASLYSYRKGTWSGRHTGVDFRANNDKVYAMGSGTVVDFGNTDLACPRASFGGWMLIKYDNGLSSIYSHLSSFSTTKGQRVETGTLVAISGNTGYSTAAHLDVKIVPSDAVSVKTWPSNGCPGKNYTTPIVAGATYFDPLGYLPLATKDMFK